MNIGGLRGNQTTYLLDGMDNTYFIGSAGAVIGPPVDALQEFKVQTNNYTADTNGSSGAVLNATIKSGSNAFHGGAYEFFRNRALNARNFFADPAGPKPQFTRNQFGANLGGPFWRDKLFFFIDYDGTRQRQAQTASTTVFTAEQKAGDFSGALGSQTGIDALGRPVYKGQIFDPLSLRRLADGTPVRDPFPGNTIPVSRLNPVAKRLIDLVPSPMTAGAPNFFRSFSNPLNLDTFVGRIDWTHSTKNFVFSHLAHNDQGSFSDPLLGFPLDGGTAWTFNLRQLQSSTGWTHVFSPVNLNEFRVGYLRNASLFEGAQSNQDLNSQYGIPFPFPGPNVGGMTSLVISGYTSLGTAQHAPFFQYINKYEVSDSFTSIRGAHSLQFGVYLALKLFHNQLNSNWGRGELDFNGVFTNQLGFSDSGNPIADFLLGTANFARLGSVTSEKDIGHAIEWFAQDKWRATNKLTVTAGLRYQFNPPTWEARDRISSVLFDRGYRNARVVVPIGQDENTFRFMRDTLFPFIPVQRATGLDRGLVHNSYKNFAPRLGIAYQIGPKTVLRTGYGIFFGFPEQMSGSVLSVNPPSKLIISNTSNGVDPTMFIDQSVFGPNPFNRALTNPDFFSVRDPHMPPELTQMYNLSVQHEFLPNWLLEVGYLGNRGSRILINTPINDAIPALPNDTSSVQSRRRVSSVLGNLPYLAPQGFSNYNALTLNVEKRFSAGFSLLANYTWSRALGVAPAITAGINDTSVQNPIDLKREYGPLEFDVKSHASIAYIYELPFGRGKHFLSAAPRPVDLALGGWQINGITTFQGGFPITPELGFSLGKTTTNSRPNLIGDPTNTARQPYDWISPTAFVVPSTAEIAAGNFFGNAGRGSLREPGLVNFDLSVFKMFNIRESMRLQFRSEFFNFTNTPFFGLPGAVSTNFDSPTFGKVTSAGTPRVVQLAMKLIF
jgi:hypothetical protein